MVFDVTMEEFEKYAVEHDKWVEEQRKKKEEEDAWYVAVPDLFFTNGCFRHDIVTPRFYIEGSFRVSKMSKPVYFPGHTDLLEAGNFVEEFLSPDFCHQESSESMT